MANTSRGSSFSVRLFMQTSILILVRSYILLSIRGMEHESKGIEEGAESINALLKWEWGG
jgi:hypothetical protein